MAVIDVHPDWNRSTGGRLDIARAQLIRTSQRRFTITVGDIQNDTPIRVKQMHVAPIEADSDPDDASLICVSAEYKNLGPTLIEVIANYETRPSDDGTGGGTDPTLAGWSIDIDAEDTQEPIDRDINNKPIITITGEQFDPLLTKDVSDLCLVFTTTNRPFNPGALWLYRNCVNSDEFIGFPPGTARIKQARGRVIRQGDGKPDQMEASVRVVFRFAAPGSTDRRAWWKRVRAEGYKYASINPLQPTVKNIYRALDDNGEPVVTPVLHSTTTGALIKNPEEAQFYEWQIYPERPFMDFFTALAS